MGHICDKMCAFMESWWEQVYIKMGDRYFIQLGFNVENTNTNCFTLYNALENIVIFFDQKHLFLVKVQMLPLICVVDR